MSRAPLVIAHRGASAERPENTLPAYERAIELGADMIEIDLHRTRDGAIAVLHDAALERIGGRGEVGDATWEELRSLDAGGGARVPSLDEVLDAFGARIPFNLELKCAERGPYPDLERRTLEAVGRRGLLARTLFSCFEDPVLAQLRSLAPEARLALLVSPESRERALARAREIGAEALNPWFGLAERGLVEAAHAAGLAVYPYTVDDPERMRALLALGVDGLFTNRPDRLRRILASPGETRDPI